MLKSKSYIAIWGLVLLSFALGIYFYPQLPERMATHWNSQGEVDGYMSKFWGVFLMPFILVGITLLFMVIPKIDPKRANIAQFRKFYDGFIVVFLLFMLIIQSLSISWNMGKKPPMQVFLPISMGLLIFYLGMLCGHAKQNWFIGIRTPWTLSSEEVWEKTHKLGASLFKAAGGITLIGAFFKQYLLAFILVPVLLVAIITIIYSYVIYQKVNVTGK